MPTGLTVFQGARVVVTFSPDLGDISDAAIAVRGNVIAWVGPSSQLPHEFAHADEVSVRPQFEALQKTIEMQMIVLHRQQLVLLFAAGTTVRPSSP